MVMFRLLDEVIFYVLVPLFIAIAVFGVYLFINTRNKKGTDSKERLYRLNFWTYVFGIFFGVMLFTMSIGFSIAFIEKIYFYHMNQAYPVILGILYVFPVLPFALLVFSVVQFVHTIRSREKD